MPFFKPRTPDTRLEARRLYKDTAEDLALWCGGMLVTEIDPHDPGITFVGINVPTQLGVERASQGDWIVKLKGGNFTVFNDQGFQDTYELADG